MSAPKAHAFPELHSSSAPDRSLWDWTVRIRAGKCELGSTYNVIIFLGAVPFDPEEWLSCPELVGKHSVLVNGRKYERRGAAADDTTEGFVHLNKAIVERSGLRSLEPDEVVPYLKQNLEWRVQKADGSVEELKSLEVVVFATPMTYPPGSMFPVPGEPRRFNSITHGRPGGSRDYSSHC